MFGRKKLTSARSRRTSERMRSATLGTHVVPRGSSMRRSSRSAGQNADGVNFSSARKTRRAERGVVDYVRPSTRSGESSEQHSQRMGRRRFAQQAQDQSRRRRTFAVVVSVLLVLCAAATAAFVAFFASLNDKLSLGDSNAGDALVAPEDPSQPYYVLCVAQLGAAQGAVGPETDAFLLVRVDEASKALTLVSLPSNLSIQLSDGQMHPLYEAVGLGGDAELVKSVSQFAAVDIAHFVRTDAEGIAHLVDVAGGVAVDIPQEVDDPTAGSVYLQAGEQVVDAQGALTLLRAKNFTGGVSVQAENRALFTAALAERLLEAKGGAFRLLLDEVAGDVQTDWSASQVIDVADALRGMSAAQVYEGVVPGYAATMNDGTSRYVAYSGEWAAMMERVRAGEDPSYVEDPAYAVDPGGFVIEIRNGADIAGAAAQMQGILEGQGFAVETIGNVDDYTLYPETLVIYKDPAYETAAHAVVNALDVGRVVNGGDYYAFETNVLVVLGQDWQPIV